MKRFVVSTDDTSKRLDVFVAGKMPAVSRAFVHRLCLSGKITVNGTEGIPKKKLHEGDVVEVQFDPKSPKNIPKIDMPIIYEDDDCMVINKPAGVLTHSKGAYNPEATVATFIRPKLHGLSGERSGIVHRLDRATSGIIIVAKNPDAQAWLQKQFSTRKVKKSYIAVVEGQLDPAKAIIDMPIGRNPKHPQTFRVGEGGKSAITAYETLQGGSKYSLVKLTPQTGRTHQLRVHMKHQGHPIVGDSLYGGEPADRMYLHALSLEITLPNRQRKTFVVDLPSAFNNIVG